MTFYGLTSAGLRGSTAQGAGREAEGVNVSEKHVWSTKFSD